MTARLEDLKPDPMLQGLVGRSDEGGGNPFSLAGAHHHKETPS